jgi:hypothetical protein
MSSLARRKSEMPWFRFSREKRKRSQGIPKSKSGEKDVEQGSRTVQVDVPAKASPIVEFSRKEVVLKTCTPVRPVQSPNSSVVINEWDNAPQQM